MLSELYQNVVLKKPKVIFLILITALLSFGYFSKDFKLDASSDTLLIEGDPDLKYLREITERYGAKDFLVLTFTPKDPITSENSINNLLSLKYKIQSLDWVHSVITLLDVPLLNNSDKSLQERLENLVTLKDENVDKERGFKEILDSPVFRNFVISEDGNTTGIIVNIKKDDIVVFGVGVLLFIIATLWFVFRKLIWIIVPISSCFFSVLIMIGLLGLLGWKVTVISSNFIALMLILTMAMNIHMLSLIHI